MDWVNPEQIRCAYWDRYRGIKSRPVCVVGGANHMVVIRLSPSSILIMAWNSLARRGLLSEPTCFIHFPCELIIIDMYISTSNAFGRTCPSVIVSVCASEFTLQVLEKTWSSVNRLLISGYFSVNLIGGDIVMVRPSGSWEGNRSGSVYLHGQLHESFLLVYKAGPLHDYHFGSWKKAQNGFKLKWKILSINRAPVDQIGILGYH